MNGVRKKLRVGSLPGRVQRRVARIGETALLHGKTQLAWLAGPAEARPHLLPEPLIVSLTSHAKRFGHLALTLKCLLSQSVKADATVLWVAADEHRYLPKSVLDLQDSGLEIRKTRDIGPYTKLIPALRSYPGAFVATADDDVYYGSTWLERLVRGYSHAAPSIICHRAHRLRFDETGYPLGYLRWEWEVPAPETSPDLLATGVGGVLYFPGALPGEALDENAFRAIAPRADDLWLYWMERRQGVNVTTLGHARPLVTWLGTQRYGLNRSNVDGATMNDTTIRLLIAAYGQPLEVPRLSQVA